MKFTRNDLIRQELLDGLGKQMATVGWLDKGTHVTEVIYCLTKSAYRRMYGSKNTEKEELMFAIGLGLEKVLLKDQEDVEAEQFDGLWYSIDRNYTKEGVPIEFKSTRMSPNKTEFSLGWRYQMLAYMKAKGITRMLLGVLYVIQPELQTWDVETDEDELGVFWNWIKQRQWEYEWFMERGLFPTPFKYRLAEWECSNCSWKVICDARKLSETEVTPE